MCITTKKWKLPVLFPENRQKTCMLYYVCYNRGNCSGRQEESRPRENERGTYIMIDITYAKQQFQKYLEAYDRSDDRIQLKAVHTAQVGKAADVICREEGMTQEDHQLALLIALLHDIGRFEQLKQFHSFDDRLFDHAVFGVKVLFEDGRISDFIKDRSYDEVIRKAILYHSCFSLEEAGELTPKERLHCQIIRDADKLDNFRVKDTEKIETLFGVGEDVVAMEEISPHILETVRVRKCVRSSERVTHMDFWVSYLAFIFGLNFPASFRWIERQNYMNRNIDRMVYKNPKTKQDMEEIRQICNDYIKERMVLTKEER